MENELENKSGTGRDEQGRFIKGVSGNPEGMKPYTEEDKIKKKAQKIMIEDYVAKLTEALEELSPILIKKAKGGDMIAIKELHDRAMGKAQQNVDIKTDGQSLNPMNKEDLAKLIANYGYKQPDPTTDEVSSNDDG